MKHKNIIL